MVKWIPANWAKFSANYERPFNCDPSHIIINFLLLHLSELLSAIFIESIKGTLSGGKDKLILFFMCSKFNSPKFCQQTVQFASMISLNQLKMVHVEFVERFG